MTVSHNLSWAQHIHDICKKARRVLGTIYHRITKNTNDSRIILRLYTALVRPHLEYYTFCPLKYLFMFYGALHISICHIVYRVLLCRIAIKKTFLTTA